MTKPIPRISANTADEIDTIAMPVKFHLQKRAIDKLGRIARGKQTSLSGLIRHMVQTHPLFQEP